MMKYNPNILTPMVALFLLLSACAKDDLNNDADNTYVTMRIAANVASFQGGDTRAHTTRALGQEEEEGSETVGIEPGKGLEDFVGNLRVLVFLPGDNGKLVFSKLFLNDPALPNDSENKLTIENGNPTTALFKMSPGIYRFVLVANERTKKLEDLELGYESDWNLRALTPNVSTYQDFVTNRHSKNLQVLYYNEINVAGSDMMQPYAIPALDWLNKRINGVNGSRELGIPMTASANVTVPGGTYPKEAPWTTDPIALKREWIKFEVGITNLDVDGAVYPNAKFFRFAELQLVDIPVVYNLLEAQGVPDYQQLGMAVMFGGGSDVEVLPGSKFPGLGEPLNSPVVFSSYHSPYIAGNVESEYPFLWLGFADKDGVIVKRYRIPIFQYKPDGVTRDYNLYRNTIYRIMATYKGQELKCNIQVIPWDKGPTIDYELGGTEYVVQPTP